MAQRTGSLGQTANNLMTKPVERVALPTTERKSMLETRDDLTEITTGIRDRKASHAIGSTRNNSL